MISCHECRARMYPMDPRVAQYHKGKRYAPLCEACDASEDEGNDLEDRVSNLEAITAEPGGIPRWYHDQIQQLRNELAHCKMQIIQMRAKKPKTPQRSTYRGLTSES